MKRDWHQRPMAYAIYYFGSVFVFAIGYAFGSFAGMADEPIDRAVDAVYLSVVTLTTLGFGDVLPQSTYGKVLVSLQALWGVFMIGAFLNAVPSQARYRAFLPIRPHVYSELHYLTNEVGNLVLGRQYATWDRVRVTHKPLPDLEVREWRRTDSVPEVADYLNEDRFDTDQAQADTVLKERVLALAEQLRELVDTLNSLRNPHLEQLDPTVIETSLQLTHTCIETAAALDDAAQVYTADAAALMTQTRQAVSALWTPYQAAMAALATTAAFEPDTPAARPGEVQS